MAAYLLAALAPLLPIAEGVRAVLLAVTEAVRRKLHRALQEFILEGNRRAFLKCGFFCSLGHDILLIDRCLCCVCSIPPQENAAITLHNSRESLIQLREFN